MPRDLSLSYQGELSVAIYATNLSLVEKKLKSCNFDVLLYIKIM
jgi:hypothetical protein